MILESRREGFAARNLGDEAGQQCDDEAVSRIDSLDATVGAYHRPMGSWQPFFWILGALLAFASLIMALARTSPNDAVSNLSQWIDWVGLHRLATHLRSPAIDRRVIRIGLISIGILLFSGGVGIGMWWTEGTNDISIQVPSSPLLKPAPPPEIKERIISALSGIADVNNEDINAILTASQGVINRVDVGAIRQALSDILRKSRSASEKIDRYREDIGPLYADEIPRRLPIEEGLDTFKRNTARILASIDGIASLDSNSSRILREFIIADITSAAGEVTGMKMRTNDILLKLKNELNRGP